MPQWPQPMRPTDVVRDTLRIYQRLALPRNSGLAHWLGARQVDAIRPRARISGTDGWRAPRHQSGLLLSADRSSRRGAWSHRHRSAATRRPREDDARVLRRLIGFGLVALIGAFATRWINPGEVLAWRYLPLFTPILGVVVALLVLCLEAEPFSLKTIGSSSAVVAVFIARLAVGTPDVTPLIAHFENRETFFARYDPDTFDQLSGGMEEYFRFQMPFCYRDDDVAVTRILDWQADHVRFDDR